jgi:hypothetical protein
VGKSTSENEGGETMSERITITSAQRQEFERILLSHLPVLMSRKTKRQIGSWLAIVKRSLDEMTVFNEANS